MIYGEGHQIYNLNDHTDDIEKSSSYLTSLQPYYLIMDRYASIYIKTKFAIRKKKKKSSDSGKQHYLATPQPNC